MKNKILLFFFVLILSATFKAQISGQIKKGFKALYVYDYFKAKAIFYSTYQKRPNPASAYGLALIYQRKDNPFSNADSAVKYAQMAIASYDAEAIEDSVAGFVIDKIHLGNFLEHCSNEHFVRSSENPDIQKLDHFLAWNSMCSLSLREDAITMRDLLELNHAKKLNQSAITSDFFRHHPCSPFYGEAFLLFEQQIYEESCPNKSLEELRLYLEKNPSTSMRQSALAKLYEKSLQSPNLNDLLWFVKQYPDASQNHETWKWIFTRSVKEYTDQELVKFLSLYPEFPLKNSILHELKLSKLLLLPVLLEEQFAYVDTLGQLRTLPLFDEAREFSEELAVVGRNDSLWYINKTGDNVFNLVFEEAFPFYSGSAAVKAMGQWFFINRLGQQISPYFEEINELNNGLYVVKTNGLFGAIDRYGQSAVSARFQSLRDFKNDYAVFRKGERFGFVSVKNQEHPAEFNWLSDFDENALAICRLNNGFGLVNQFGEKVLPAVYDQILPLGNANYLLVKEGKYGFYRAEGCFISDLLYDFQVGKETSYYFSADWYRLIKGKHMSLVDGNGFTRVNFKVYEDMGFFQEGLMWVRKKNKFGFVDRKLQMVIQPQYSNAGDFKDGRCIVKLESDCVLIGPDAKVYIPAADEIERLPGNLFRVQRAGNLSLCDAQGQILHEELKQIQLLYRNYLALILKNSEIKILKLKS